MEALFTKLNDADLESILNVQAQNDRDYDIKPLLSYKTTMMKMMSGMMIMKHVASINARDQSWLAKALKSAKKDASNPNVGGSILRTVLPAIANEEDSDDIMASCDTMTDEDFDDIVAIEVLLQNTAQAHNRGLSRKALQRIKKVTHNSVVKSIGGEILKNGQLSFFRISPPMLFIAGLGVIFLIRQLTMMTIRFLSLKLCLKTRSTFGKLFKKAKDLAKK